MPRPSSSSTSRPRLGASARTARIPAATGSRTSRWAPTFSSRRGSTRRRSSSSSGTVCAYPKFASVPFSEDELWDGYPEETNAPYGVAKKAVLVGAQAYREQYGLDAIFLLPTNLYGPRDNFDLETSHVIPALIRKMVEAEDEVVLWGDGSPTREFLYVDDCVDGLVLAAERYDGADPVNLGAAREISIRELAELIADVTGYEGGITWDSSKPNGQPRRSVDATRARELFGFEAKTSLREGIERTVAWYRTAVAGVGTT